MEKRSRYVSFQGKCSLPCTGNSMSRWKYHGCCQDDVPMQSWRGAAVLVAGPISMFLGVSRTKWKGVLTIQESLWSHRGRMGVRKSIEFDVYFLKLPKNNRNITSQTSQYYCWGAMHLKFLGIAIFLCHFMHAMLISLGEHKFRRQWHKNGKRTAA